MIVFCRIYNSRKELMEGEPPINEFAYNHAKAEGRRRMGKTATWAVHNGKVCVTWPASPEDMERHRRKMAREETAKICKICGGSGILEDDHGLHVCDCRA